jgi:hypothetical protein
MRHAEAKAHLTWEIQSHLTHNIAQIIHVETCFTYYTEVSRGAVRVQEPGIYAVATPQLRTRSARD